MAGDRSSIILTLNAGSSSVKWALFRAGLPPIRISAGKLERIGLRDGILSVTDAATGRSD
jgi:acetate kinase